MSAYLPVSRPDHAIEERSDRILGPNPDQMVVEPGHMCTKPWTYRNKAEKNWTNCIHSSRKISTRCGDAQQQFEQKSTYIYTYT